MLALSVLLTIATSVAPLPACGDLCSGDAFQAYGIVLAFGHFGRSNFESAAFLVRERDGRLLTRRWQSSEAYRAQYDGPTPAGCAAIIHTHPLGQNDPSANDVLEAKRIGIPIIVVTPDAVTVARPDGSVEKLANGRGWVSRSR
jgi:proteasome lid subunit RPN8/RPN11